MAPPLHNPCKRQTWKHARRQLCHCGTMQGLLELCRFCSARRHSTTLPVHVIKRTDVGMTRTTPLFARQANNSPDPRRRVRCVLARSTFSPRQTLLAYGRMGFLSQIGSRKARPATGGLRPRAGPARARAVSRSGRKVHDTWLSNFVLRVAAWPLSST
jgi:hypothetical protein